MFSTAPGTRARARAPLGGCRGRDRVRTAPTWSRRSRRRRSRRRRGRRRGSRGPRGRCAAGPRPPLAPGADLRVARADPGHEQELAARGLGGGECAAGLVGLDRQGHDRAGPRPRSAAGAAGSGCRAVPCQFSRRVVSAGSTRCSGTVFPGCKQDYRLRRTASALLVGRPILQSRCSSASRTGPSLRRPRPRGSEDAQPQLHRDRASCSAWCASRTASPALRS